MKIRVFIITTSILTLVLISAIIFFNWNKHLIYLSNGDVIEADKTWVVFDEVYYEKGAGTLFTVKTNTVDEILSANFSSLYDWKMIISHALESKQGVFGILASRLTWFVCLGVFCIFAAMVLIRILLSFKIQRKEKEDDDEIISISISSQISDLEKIVLFFFNMYLQQLKAKKKDRYHYQQIDMKGPLNTTVYEFRVNIDGQWQSRRISLGRIGEDSGARSKCFYVIYDDHFVVKIPPEPVTDINEYIQSIKADRQIADILAPRECLVPKISIVLKQIPVFIKSIGKSAINNEQQCIDGLNEHPEFQKFLKIGDSFAFYMDLSRHFFLGQIIKDCHDAESEISREIHQRHELIWSPQAFADRYGEDSAYLCSKLHNIYEQFGKQFTDPAIPSFQKKAWFAVFFTGDNDASILRKIPANALTILKMLKNEQAKILDEYTFLIQNYTREKFSKQNRVKIQCICSRLVELLAWLFFKKIAIRDLKPDNLLVAGDPSKYPHFLNANDGFEIGLIDVEIAVNLNPENQRPGNGKVGQPKLGWTPFYATPSHMFINEVLKHLSEDMVYMFFLQDWYATVAIIYQAVTGEKLFIKTAATLVNYSRELHRYYGDGSKMISFAKKANKEFWQDAAEEFALKKREKEALLSSVHLEIGQTAKKMFKAAAAKSGQEAIQLQLRDIKSNITAYALLECLFAHINEVMTVNNDHSLI